MKDSERNFVASALSLTDKFGMFFTVRTVIVHNIRQRLIPSRENHVSSFVYRSH